MYVGGVQRVPSVSECQLVNAPATPVSLVTVDQERDELGPEVTRANNQLAPLSDGHLSPSQKSDLAELQKRFADVFSPLPGRTSLIHHHVETTPGVSVRTRPYRLPEHKKKLVQAEIRAMLELGVIEESHSAWSSPIVLVVSGSQFSVCQCQFIFRCCLIVFMFTELLPPTHSFPFHHSLLMAHFHDYYRIQVSCFFTSAT